MTYANPMFPPRRRSPDLVPMMPPPVIPGGQQWGHLPSISARRDGHPLAHLMAMREQAAEQIDALMEFLDATEGDIDLSPNLADGEWDDREGDHVDEEPSLGWTETGAIGSDTDLEVEAAA